MKTNAVDLRRNMKDIMRAVEYHLSLSTANTKYFRPIKELDV